MTNHPNRSGKFELVFVGASALNAYRIPRYRRMHRTLESATEVALSTHAKMREQGLPTACHQAIVYGPGCGRDGRVVSDS